MKYRAEIDGLRTVAVLSVLFFHFGFLMLAGGYVGVDVFFVVSGYLITFILLSDLANNTLCFKTFFDKRIRRLFPALFAVLLASFVLARILFMPEEFKAFAESVVATSLYLSNFFFWLKSDYFTGPSELKPLLHTWSLAVEEQFYFVFPLILMISFRYLRKFVFHIIIGLLFLSFFSGILLLNVNPSAAFFLSPFRVWELLVGSLLAYLHFSGRVTHGKYSALFTIVGLAMIVVPAFIYDKSTNFPGFNALIPVLGTALIIADQSGKGILLNLLSSAPFVYLGKISYSLYLWHWPVVVFYGYWLLHPPLLADKLLMILITLILSIISFHLFEKPFRKPVANYSFAKSFGVSAVFSLIFICLGIYVSQRNGLPERFHLETSMIEKYSAQRDIDNPCFLTKEQKFSSWDPSECKFEGVDSTYLSILWGDSHANHLLPGLKNLESKLRNDILVFTNAGCPPIKSVNISGRPNCASNNSDIVNYIIESGVRRVYLAASWHYAFEQSGMTLKDLQDTISLLRSLDIEIIVINQLPIYSIANPSYLIARLASKDALNKDYLLRPANGLGLGDTLRYELQDTRIINLQKAFCNDDGLCTIYKGGKLMVADQAHLSNAGSVVAAEFLLPYLNEN